jgi:hypothetical protein
VAFWVTSNIDVTQNVYCNLQGGWPALCLGLEVGAALQSLKFGVPHPLRFVKL